LWTEVPKLFCRMRSRETRSRSTSAATMCERLLKRSLSASMSPLS
jgi:hypothetical protein